MNPVFILMMIFGICIFLYGVDIYVSKKPFIPRYYKKTITKSYRHYVGKTVMFVSLSPILGGLVSCLGDSVWVVLFMMIVMIGSFVLFLYIAIHYFQEK